MTARVTPVDSDEARPDPGTALQRTEPAKCCMAPCVNGTQGQRGRGHARRDSHQQNTTKDGKGKSMAETLPMRETPIPAQRCPRCGTVQEFATSPWADASPRVGDVSVCLGCGSAQVFDEGLRLRLLTAEERWALSGEDLRQLVRVEIAVRATLRKGA